MKTFQNWFDTVLDNYHLTMFRVFEYRRGVKPDWLIARTGN